MRWSAVLAGLVIGAVIGFIVTLPTRVPKVAPTNVTKVTLRQFVIETEKKVDDCRVPERSEVKAAEAVLLSAGTTARQNEYADRYGFPRVADMNDLNARLAKGVFEPLPETHAYRYGDGFAEMDPTNRERYQHALPHMKPFLDDLLGEAYRCFGEDMRKAEASRLESFKTQREALVATLSARRDKKAKFQLASLRPLDLRERFDRFTIDSLLRTETYQSRLVKKGRWPAARGDSPEQRTTHTTGATIDIGLTMVPPHIRDWLRVRLARLEREGRIDVVEERGRSTICAHIMVLPEATLTDSSVAAGE